MTKTFKNPKILALNMELELKSEKDNAEVRLSDPAKYQEIVDRSGTSLRKARQVRRLGANIILSKLAIGDLATQYFADRGLFCAGRVEAQDLQRVTRATGAPVQTTVNNITDAQLGSASCLKRFKSGTSATTSSEDAHRRRRARSS